MPRIDGSSFAAANFEARWLAANQEHAGTLGPGSRLPAPSVPWPDRGRGRGFGGPAASGHQPFQTSANRLTLYVPPPPARPNVRRHDDSVRVFSRAGLDGGVAWLGVAGSARLSEMQADTAALPVAVRRASARAEMNTANTAVLGEGGLGLGGEGGRRARPGASSRRWIRL